MTSCCACRRGCRLKHGKPANCVLEPVEIEPAMLNNGESITDAIERLRRRGRELRADLHRIASAPYPSSYAKQRMRAIVEALAQEGTPDVASLIEHDRVIGWPQARLTSQVYNVPNAQGAVAFGRSSLLAR